ncbi:MAG: hypothetical protein P9L88_01090 [Candidatus Tantalella remota]|nr:hypothetical protein [Candidatus Tantalella remota]
MADKIREDRKEESAKVEEGAAAPVSETGEPAEGEAPLDEFKAKEKTETAQAEVPAEESEPTVDVAGGKTLLGSDLFESLMGALQMDAQKIGSRAGAASAGFVSGRVNIAAGFQAEKRVRLEAADSAMLEGVAMTESGIAFAAIADPDLAVAALSKADEFGLLSDKAITSAGAKVISEVVESNLEKAAEVITAVGEISPGSVEVAGADALMKIRQESPGLLADAIRAVGAITTEPISQVGKELLLDVAKNSPQQFKEVIEAVAEVSPETVQAAAAEIIEALKGTDIVLSEKVADILLAAVPEADQAAKESVVVDKPYAEITPIEFKVDGVTFVGTVDPDTGELVVAAAVQGGVEGLSLKGVEVRVKIRELVAGEDVSASADLITLYNETVEGVARFITDHISEEDKPGSKTGIEGQLDTITSIAKSLANSFKKGGLITTFTYLTSVGSELEFKAKVKNAKLKELTLKASSGEGGTFGSGLSTNGPVALTTGGDGDGATLIPQAAQVVERFRGGVTSLKELVNAIQMLRGVTGFDKAVMWNAGGGLLYKASMQAGMLNVTATFRELVAGKMLELIPIDIISSVEVKSDEMLASLVETATAKIGAIKTAISKVAETGWTAAAITGLGSLLMEHTGLPLFRLDGVVPKGLFKQPETRTTSAEQTKEEAAQTPEDRMRESGITITQVEKRDMVVTRTDVIKVGGYEVKIGRNKKREAVSVSVNGKNVQLFNADGAMKFDPNMLVSALQQVSQYEKFGGNGITDGYLRTALTDNSFKSFFTNVISAVKSGDFNSAGKLMTVLKGAAVTQSRARFMGAGNISVQFSRDSKGDWGADMNMDFSGAKPLTTVIERGKLRYSGTVSMRINSMGQGSLTKDLIMTGDRGQGMKVMAKDSVVGLSIRGLDILSATVQVGKVYTRKVSAPATGKGEGEGVTEGTNVVTFEVDDGGTFIKDSTLTVQNGQFIAEAGTTYILGDSFKSEGASNTISIAGTPLTLRGTGDSIVCRGLTVDSVKYTAGKVLLGQALSEMKISVSRGKYEGKSVTNLHRWTNANTKESVIEGKIEGTSAVYTKYEGTTILRSDKNILQYMQKGAEVVLENGQITEILTKDVGMMTVYRTAVKGKVDPVTGMKIDIAAGTKIRATALGSKVVEGLKTITCTRFYDPTEDGVYTVYEAGTVIKETAEGTTYPSGKIMTVVLEDKETTIEMKDASGKMIKVRQVRQAGLTIVQDKSGTSYTSIAGLETTFLEDFANKAGTMFAKAGTVLLTNKFGQNFVSGDLKTITEKLKTVGGTFRVEIHQKTGQETTMLALVKGTWTDIFMTKAGDLGTVLVDKKTGFVVGNLSIENRKKLLTHKTYGKEYKYTENELTTNIKNGDLIGNDNFRIRDVYGYVAAGPGIRMGKGLEMRLGAGDWKSMSLMSMAEDFVIAVDGEGKPMASDESLTSMVSDLLGYKLENLNRTVGDFPINKDQLFKAMKEGKWDDSQIASVVTVIASDELAGKQNAELGNTGVTYMDALSGNQKIREQMTIERSEQVTSTYREQGSPVSITEGGMTVSYTPLGAERTETVTVTSSIKLDLAGTLQELFSKGDIKGLADITGKAAKLDIAVKNLSEFGDVIVPGTDITLAVAVEFVTEEGLLTAISDGDFDYIGKVANQFAAAKGLANELNAMETAVPGDMTMGELAGKAGISISGAYGTLRNGKVEAQNNLTAQFGTLRELSNMEAMTGDILSAFAKSMGGVESGSYTLKLNGNDVGVTAAFKKDGVTGAKVFDGVILSMKSVNADFVLGTIFDKDTSVGRGAGKLKVDTIEFKIGANGALELRNDLTWIDTSGQFGKAYVLEKGAVMKVNAEGKLSVVSGMMEVWGKHSVNLGKFGMDAAQGAAGAAGGTRETPMMIGKITKDGDNYHLSAGPRIRKGAVQSGNVAYVKVAIRNDKAVVTEGMLLNIQISDTDTFNLAGTSITGPATMVYSSINGKGAEVMTFGAWKTTVGEKLKEYTGKGRKGKDTSFQREASITLQGEVNGGFILKAERTLTAIKYNTMTTRITKMTPEEIVQVKTLMSNQGIGGDVIALIDRDDEKHTGALAEAAAADTRVARVVDVVMAITSAGGQMGQWQKKEDVKGLIRELESLAGTKIFDSEGQLNLLELGTAMLEGAGVAGLLSETTKKIAAWYGDEGTRLTTWDKYGGGIITATTATVLAAVGTFLLFTGVGTVAGVSLLVAAGKVVLSGLIASALYTVSKVVGGMIEQYKYGTVSLEGVLFTETGELDKTIVKAALTGFAVGVGMVGVVGILSGIKWVAETIAYVKNMHVAMQVATGAVVGSVTYVAVTHVPVIYNNIVNGVKWNTGLSWSKLGAAIINGAALGMAAAVGLIRGEALLKLGLSGMAKAMHIATTFAIGGTIGAVGFVAGDAYAGKYAGAAEAGNLGLRVVTSVAIGALAGFVAVWAFTPGRLGGFDKLRHTQTHARNYLSGPGGVAGVMLKGSMHWIGVSAMFNIAGGTIKAALTNAKAGWGKGKGILGSMVLGIAGFFTGGIKTEGGHSVLSKNGRTDILGAMAHGIKAGVIMGPLIGLMAGAPVEKAVSGGLRWTSKYIGQPLVNFVRSIPGTFEMVAKVTLIGAVLKSLDQTAALGNVGLTKGANTFLSWALLFAIPGFQALKRERVESLQKKFGMISQSGLNTTMASAARSVMRIMSSGVKGGIQGLAKKQAGKGQVAAKARQLKYSAYNTAEADAIARGKTHAESYNAKTTKMHKKLGLVTLKIGDRIIITTQSALAKSSSTWRASRGITDQDVWMSQAMTENVLHEIQEKGKDVSQEDMDKAMKKANVRTADMMKQMDALIEGKMVHAKGNKQEVIDAANKEWAESKLGGTIAEILTGTKNVSEGRGLNEKGEITGGKNTIANRLRQFAETMGGVGSNGFTALVYTVEALNYMVKHSGAGKRICPLTKQGSPIAVEGVLVKSVLGIMYSHINNATGGAAASRMNFLTVPCGGGKSVISLVQQVALANYALSSGIAAGNVKVILLVDSESNLSQTFNTEKTLAMKGAQAFFSQQGMGGVHKVTSAKGMMGKKGGLFIMTAKTGLAILHGNAKLLKNSNGFTADEADTVLTGSSLTMRDSADLYSRQSGKGRLFLDSMHTLVLEAGGSVQGLHKGKGRFRNFNRDGKNGKLYLKVEVAESLLNNILSNSPSMSGAIKGVGGKAHARTVLTSFLNQATEILVRPEYMTRGSKLNYKGSGSRRMVVSYDLKNASGETMKNTQLGNAWAGMGNIIRGQLHTKQTGRRAAAERKVALNTFLNVSGGGVNMVQLFDYINANNNLVKGGEIGQLMSGTADGIQTMLKAMGATRMNLGTSGLNMDGIWKLYTSNQPAIRDAAGKLESETSANKNRAHGEKTFVLSANISPERMLEVARELGYKGSGKFVRGKIVFKTSDGTRAVMYENPNVAAKDVGRVGTPRGASFNTTAETIHIVGRLRSGANLLKGGELGLEAGRKGKLMFRKVKMVATELGTDADVTQQEERGNARGRATTDLFRFVNVYDTQIRNSGQKSLARHADKGREFSGSDALIGGKNGNGLLLNAMRDYGSTIDGNQSTMVVSSRQQMAGSFASAGNMSLAVVWNNKAVDAASALGMDTGMDYMTVVDEGTSFGDMTTEDLLKATGAADMAEVEKTLGMPLGEFLEEFDSAGVGAGHATYMPELEATGMQYRTVGKVAGGIAAGAGVTAAVVGSGGVLGVAAVVGVAAGAAYGMGRGLGQFVQRARDSGVRSALVALTTGFRSKDFGNLSREGKISTLVHEAMPAAIAHGLGNMGLATFASRGIRSLVGRAVIGNQAYNQIVRSVDAMEGTGSLSEGVEDFIAGVNTGAIKGAAVSIIARNYAEAAGRLTSSLNVSGDVSMSAVTAAVSEHVSQLKDATAGVSNNVRVTALKSLAGMMAGLAAGMGRNELMASAPEISAVMAVIADRAAKTDVTAENMGSMLNAMGSVAEGMQMLSESAVSDTGVRNNVRDMVAGVAGVMNSIAAGVTDMNIDTVARTADTLSSLTTAAVDSGIELSDLGGSMADIANVVLALAERLSSADAALADPADVFSAVAAIAETAETVGTTVESVRGTLSDAVSNASDALTDMVGRMDETSSASLTDAASALEKLVSAAESLQAVGAETGIVQQASAVASDLASHLLGMESGIGAILSLSGAIATLSGMADTSLTKQTLMAAIGKAMASLNKTTAGMEASASSGQKISADDIAGVAKALENLASNMDSEDVKASAADLSNILTGLSGMLSSVEMTDQTATPVTSAARSISSVVNAVAPQVMTDAGVSERSAVQNTVANTVNVMAKAADRLNDLNNTGIQVGSAELAGLASAVAEMAPVVNTQLSAEVSAKFASTIQDVSALVASVKVDKADISSMAGAVVSLSSAAAAVSADQAQTPETKAAVQQAVQAAGTTVMGNIANNLRGVRAVGGTVAIDAVTGSADALTALTAAMDRPGLAAASVGFTSMIMELFAHMPVAVDSENVVHMTRAFDAVIKAIDNTADTFTEAGTKAVAEATIDSLRGLADFADTAQAATPQLKGFAAEAHRAADTLTAAADTGNAGTIKGTFHNISGSASGMLSMLPAVKAETAVSAPVMTRAAARMHQASPSAATAIAAHMDTVPQAGGLISDAVKAGYEGDYAGAVTSLSAAGNILSNTPGLQQLSDMVAGAEQAFGAKLASAEQTAPVNMVSGLRSGAARAMASALGSDLKQAPMLSNTIDGAASAIQKGNYAQADAMLAAASDMIAAAVVTSDNIAASPEVAGLAGQISDTRAAVNARMTQVRTVGATGLAGGLNSAALSAGQNVAAAAPQAAAAFAPINMAVTSAAAAIEAGDYATADMHLATAAGLLTQAIARHDTLSGHIADLAPVVADTRAAVSAKMVDVRAMTSSIVTGNLNSAMGHVLQTDSGMALATTTKTPQAFTAIDNALRQAGAAFAAGDIRGAQAQLTKAHDTASVHADTPAGAFIMNTIADTRGALHASYDDARSAKPVDVASSLASRAAQTFRTDAGRQLVAETPAAAAVIASAGEALKRGDMVSAGQYLAAAHQAVTANPALAKQPEIRALANVVAGAIAAVNAKTETHASAPVFGMSQDLKASAFRAFNSDMGSQLANLAPRVESLVMNAGSRVAKGDLARADRDLSRAADDMMQAVAQAPALARTPEVRSLMNGIAGTHAAVMSRMESIKADPAIASSVQALTQSMAKAMEPGMPLAGMTAAPEITKALNNAAEAAARNNFAAANTQLANAANFMQSAVDVNPALADVPEVNVLRGAIADVKARVTAPEREGASSVAVERLADTFAWARGWINSVVDITGTTVTINRSKLVSHLENLTPEQRVQIEGLMEPGINVSVKGAHVDDMIASLGRVDKRSLSEDFGIDKPVFTVEGSELKATDRGDMQIKFDSDRARQDFVDRQLALTAERKEELEKLSGIVRRTGDITPLAEALSSVLAEWARYNMAGFESNDDTAKLISDSIRDVLGSIDTGRRARRDVLMGKVSEKVNRDMKAIELVSREQLGYQPSISDRMAIQKDQQMMKARLVRDMQVPVGAGVVDATGVDMAAMGMRGMLATGKDVKKPEAAPADTTQQEVTRKAVAEADMTPETKAAPEAADEKKTQIGKVREKIPAAAKAGKAVRTIISEAGIVKDRKDLLALTQVAGAIINLLRQGVMLDKNTHVYVVSARSSESKDFRAAVRTFDQINTTLGRDQFRVVVVGDESAKGRIDSLKSSSTSRDATLEYRSLSDVDPNMRNDFVSVETEEAGGEVRMTGIADSKDDITVQHTIARATDKLVVADSFGTALVLAITSDSGLTAEFTDEAVEKIRDMVSEAKKEAVKQGGAGSRAVIRLESASSEETDKAIDDYLFGDLEADTAF